MILAAVIALAWGGWRWWSQKKEDEKTYQAVVISRGDLDISVLATGIVQPENRLEIKPPIAGRVETIEVEEGQKVHKGQVLAWMSSGDRAALLDAARAKGPQELAHWEDLFKPTPLLAPLEGLIIVKNVVPGQVVATTDVVLVMSDHLMVNTQVDETDIGQVRLGEKVQISLDAYPKDAISGKVTRVAFESRTVNNVTIYDVEVLPDKVPDFMRSGMTANVKFFVESRKGVLLLPTEAIRQENGKAAVWVPNPSDAKRPLSREIRLGLSDGKRTELVSGLAEGETILVPSLEKLRSKEVGTSNPFSPLGGRRPR
jgi:macrolide-specific efflux system membrane fusion protein